MATAREAADAALAEALSAEEARRAALARRAADAEAAVRAAATRKQRIKDLRAKAPRGAHRTPCLERKAPRVFAVSVAPSQEFRLHLVEQA